MSGFEIRTCEGNLSPLLIKVVAKGFNELWSTKPPVSLRSDRAGAKNVVMLLLIMSSQIFNDLRFVGEIPLYNGELSFPESCET